MTVLRFDMGLSTAAHGTGSYKLAGDPLASIAHHDYRLDSAMDWILQVSNSRVLLQVETKLSPQQAAHRSWRIGL